MELGKINFYKGHIDLELSDMVESNFTIEQSVRVNGLWQEMAELIELSLKQMVERG